MGLGLGLELGLRLGLEGWSRKASLDFSSGTATMTGSASCCGEGEG